MKAYIVTVTGERGLERIELVGPFSDRNAAFLWGKEYRDHDLRWNVVNLADDVVVSPLPLRTNY